jgi:hypothetical protein
VTLYVLSKSHPDFKILLTRFNPEILARLTSGRLE